MFTFAASMGVSSPGPGAHDDRKSNVSDEAMGRVEKSIQFLQQWTEKMEDRLERLEADACTDQSKIRESNALLQGFESKLKVLGVREERFDRLVNALERVLEDNSANPGLRTELNSNLQLGKLMSSPDVVGFDNEEQTTTLMASPSVIRTPRENVNKLFASEKCMPLLDFPERIKPPVSNSAALVRSRAVSPEPSVEREAVGGKSPGGEASMSALNDDASASLHQTGTMQTNEKKSVEECSIENINKDMPVLVIKLHRCIIPPMLNKNAVVPEKPQLNRTSKRKRIASSTETGSDFDKSRLPRRKSQRISSSCNFKPSPEKLHNAETMTSTTKKIVVNPGTTSRKKKSPRTPDSKMKTSQAGYKCPTCEKVFSKISDYRDDQRFHIVGKPKCHLCSTEFINIKNFRAHFKRAHPGCTPTELPRVEVSTPDLDYKPFVCHVLGCDKSYRSKGNLQMHLQCHAGEKFKCDLCDFEYSWRANLIKHNRKAHQHKALQGKESATSVSGSRSKKVLGAKSKKHNSNRPDPKKKNSDNNISKLKLSMHLKVKLVRLPFTPSKSADPKLSRNKSNETDDSKDANLKSPSNASGRILRSSVIASKNEQSSPKITSENRLESPPNDPYPQASPNKRHKTAVSQNESEETEAASEAEPHIPSTPPIPMIVSPAAPENGYNFEDEQAQVHACPLCSRSFSKISKLDRHFQKKH